MPKRQPDRTTGRQVDKFIRTARELECDENPATFSRTIRKIATAGKQPRKQDNEEDDLSPVGRT